MYVRPSGLDNKSTKDLSPFKLSFSWRLA